MKETYYKRKPGEFELRVLRDGRLVLVAPDEDLLDALWDLKTTNVGFEMRKEALAHDRDQCQCETGE